MAAVLAKEQGIALLVSSSSLAFEKKEIPADLLCSFRYPEASLPSMAVDLSDNMSSSRENEDRRRPTPVLPAGQSSSLCRVPNPSSKSNVSNLKGL